MVELIDINKQEEEGIPDYSKSDVDKAKEAFDKILRDKKNSLGLVKDQVDRLDSITGINSGNMSTPAVSSLRSLLLFAKNMLVVTDAQDQLITMLMSDLVNTYNLTNDLKKVADSAIMLQTSMEDALVKKGVLTQTDVKEAFAATRISTEPLRVTLSNII